MPSFLQFNLDVLLFVMPFPTSRVKDALTGLDLTLLASVMAAAIHAKVFNLI